MICLDWVSSRFRFRFGGLNQYVNHLINIK